MIINYDSPGQLCNRIWSLLPSIAYGLEYKEKVLIINFSEYTDSFDDLNKNKLVCFRNRQFAKRALLSLKARGYIQNGKSNIFRKLFGFNFIEGWSNRLGNAELVLKHSNEIRRIFSFNSSISDPISNSLATADNQCVTIGVHIRRGDYKEWLGGIYYYADAQYVRILSELKNQFLSQGKEVRFLLCSNEPIDFTNYENLNCFSIPNTTGTKDLCALSQCNYIIGPPSSYSQWASFMGEVPVKFIMSGDEQIYLEDFSIIRSFNTFDNGNSLNID